MREHCGLDTSSACPERETRTVSSCPAVDSCGLYRNLEVVGNVSQNMSARLCQHKQWYQ